MMIWRSSRWTVETLVRYKAYSVFALVYKWEKPSSFFDCLTFSFQKKPTRKNYVNLKISQIYFDWLLKSFWGEIMGVVFMSQSLVQSFLYFHTSWLSWRMSLSSSDFKLSAHEWRGSQLFVLHTGLVLKCFFYPELISYLVIRHKEPNLEVNLSAANQSENTKEMFNGFLVWF